MRFSFLCLCVRRVVRRERWLTRQERQRIRKRLAEASSVRAWLRAGKPRPDEARARKVKLNTFAEKCGMARPYPEVDDQPEREQ